MIRACPHCGTQNRVPLKHLASRGRCGACKRDLPPASRPIEADSESFLPLLREAAVPVLVDFWAPWCGPCRQAAPEVERAAASLAGRALVVKLNTEDHPMIASQFHIRSIPNFAVFKNGLLRWQQAGVLGQHQLEQAVLEAAGA